MSKRSRILGAAVAHGFTRRDPRVQELEGEVARLQARVAELESEKAILEQEKVDLASEKDALEVELDALRKRSLTDQALAMQMNALHRRR